MNRSQELIRSGRWLAPLRPLAVSLLFLGAPLAAQSEASDSPAPQADGDGSEAPTRARRAVEVARKAEGDVLAWINAKFEAVDQQFGVWLGHMESVFFVNVLGAWSEPHRDETGALIIGPGGRDESGNVILDANGEPKVQVRTALPAIVLWLVVAAIFFTFRMGFVNVRLFGHAIQVVRGKYDDPEDAGEVTHFQALSSALAATVGLGNIAGVAIAVSLGGPGATFWMICAGLFGMTLKFTECTLGQMYRHVDEDGHVSGGPMHYLKDGLAKRGLGPLGVVLSFVFTICCIGASFAGGNAFQVYQSTDFLGSKVAFFGEHRWVFGLIMATGVGIVVIGGVKRIGETASKLVPLMCGVYVLAALVILILRSDALPAAIGSIFSGAFDPDAIYGGVIGALVVGFQRAAFSNEAGVGSASIAHSAAKTPYPVREGIVALLEPFIDTVVVCTMTALVIVVTGVYDAPEHAKLVADRSGAVLTSEAFGSVAALAGWFPWVLLAAVILFAFSTLISWFYYGERCFVNLFSPIIGLHLSAGIYRAVFLVFVVLGSILRGTNALAFGDFMILIMALPNVLGLYLLGGEVKQASDDYVRDLRAGKFTVNEGSSSKTDR